MDTLCATSNCQFSRNQVAPAAAAAALADDTDAEFFLLLASPLLGANFSYSTLGRENE